jgi:hypothetical protein
MNINDISGKEQERERMKCKRVVKSFLEKGNFIVNDKNYFGFDVDGDLAKHLVNKGFSRWLIDDDVLNPEICGLVDFTLRGFSDCGEIFNNIKGKVVVKTEYAIHSQRYFEAHYA